QAAVDEINDKEINGKAQQADVLLGVDVNALMTGSAQVPCSTNRRKSRYMPPAAQQSTSSSIEVEECEEEENEKHRFLNYNLLDSGFLPYNAEFLE
ncbi:hypothetical protein KIN20_035092, partial [Parelaphostrongylus tenuis]